MIISLPYLKMMTVAVAHGKGFYVNLKYSFCGH